jgi:bifunctional UDP-N-acetylglucosamine pyrophosphorylase/glucosamine-1-phosphate N-acetyltransferase
VYNKKIVTENGKIKILILAGGKGKRMQSYLPKCLSPLCGKHMIKHLIEAVSQITHEKPIAIIGYLGDLVKKEMGNLCDYAYQSEPLGTGHAVASAKKECENAENILVMSGDQPFISPETIKNLILKHKESNAVITFTTTVVPDFEDWRKAFIAFGRILRQENKVIGIREFKDASEEERLIKEVNAGCYMFKANWLWKNLTKIKNDNIQNEYYLTDLFKIASEENEKIETVQIEPKEALGANTKEELEILEKFAK